MSNEKENLEPQQPKKDSPKPKKIGEALKEYLAARAAFEKQYGVKFAEWPSDKGDSK